MSGREPDIATRGLVVWHSSGEDMGPDVGISVGLGNGRSLWCGEINRDRWNAAGEEAAELGGDSGVWLIIYGPTEDETHVLGRMIDNREASERLTSAIEAAFRESDQ